MPINNFSVAVREFARAAEQPLDKPNMTLEERHARFTFVAEEFKEFAEAFGQLQGALAFQQPDPHVQEEALFKEALDVLYTMFGFMEAHGWPIEAGFNRVHKSNMSKFGPDGKFLKNEEGKVLKSENYKKPVLTDLLT